MKVHVREMERQLARPEQQREIVKKTNSSIFSWIERWYNHRFSDSAIGYVSREAFHASRN